MNTTKKGNAMQKLIDEFNSFFKGSAKAKINEERLEITIGTQTMEIALPSVVFWKEDGGERARPPQ